MNILVTLCARGGSKGIPGKNIKLLDGVPLIGYSLRIAKEFKDHFLQHNVDIALSTDSFEIVQTVKELGLSTDYIRPDYLANDVAGKVDVFRDIKEYNERKFKIKYDYLLDLDVTSPLRNLKDLSVAFEFIQKDPEALNLFSVSTAKKNPYFNLVEQNLNGYYELSKKTEISFLSRQTAPKVYELNASFYFFKREFFEEKFKSVFTEKSLIYKMPHICFDLDHQIDFDFLEYLLSNKMLDFEL